MTVAYVQHIGEQSGGTSDSTLTVTVGTAVTAGNSVIVTAVMQLSSSCTVTDSAGNTYVEDANAANSDTVGLRIFSTHDCLALPIGGTITAVWSAPRAFAHLTADEFSGLAPSSAFDDSSNDYGNATTFTAGTVGLTSGSSELTFAAFANVSNSGTNAYPAGGSFTRIATVHSQAGATGRDVTTEYLIGAGSSQSPTVTPAGNHAYAGVAVAYFAAAVTGTADVRIDASGTVSGSAVTGTASILVNAASNATVVTGRADIKLAAHATPTAPAFAVTGSAWVKIGATGETTQAHISVETDLLFRVSTDDLIFDAAIQTTDGVTSVAGVDGASHTTDDTTTPNADFTEDSPLGSWNAGAAKAAYLYQTRKVGKRNADTVTLNATPHVQQWTTGAAQSPTAYQAVIKGRLSDLISLRQKPNGGGDTFIAQCFVEGVRLQIAADGSAFIATWNVSRADLSQGQNYYTFGVSHIGDGSVLTW